MPGLRGPRKVLLVSMIGALTLLAPSVAFATSSSSTSAPNGDLTVSSSLLSNTNKDRDGNRNTATTGDTATATYSVTNNTSSTQNVTIAYVLDGPGTRFDATRTEDVTLAPNRADTASFVYTVLKKYPQGAYSLTVSATGTETASATGRLTIH